MIEIFIHSWDDDIAAQLLAVAKEVAKGFEVK